MTYSKRGSLLLSCQARLTCHLSNRRTWDSSYGVTALDVWLNQRIWIARSLSCIIRNRSPFSNKSAYNIRSRHLRHQLKTPRRLQLYLIWTSYYLFTMTSQAIFFSFSIGVASNYSLDRPYSKRSVIWISHDLDQAIRYLCGHSQWN